MKNYYTVLGLSKDASSQDIKKAYRKIALDCHPDRNPNNKQTEEKFKEASEAYNILCDEQKRAQYDRIYSAHNYSIPKSMSKKFSFFMLLSIPLVILGLLIIAVTLIIRILTPKKIFDNKN